ncbi:GntP family permease [Pedococcus sp. NPDC057267]|uniref:GntP family permease n=1 Tax=Pedococcus sp. NPDC057267 TaxID=3346077 RepID=UPI00363E539B
MTTDLLPTLHLLAASPAADAPAIPAARLVPAALIGIAVIVLLITKFKLHPFLGLTIGSLAVGAVAGVAMSDVIDSYSKGFGATAASVGTLIALGAMFGKLLADSGGADEIVDTIVGRSSARTLPWAMAGVGALIGLPMFFEIGLVLLMPVIFLVARRSGLSIIKVGIPALAGLSAMHGLVPPHPGPLVAIDALKANLGVTLGLGVLVAVPTVAIAGPLFARFAGRWVDAATPELYSTPEDEERQGAKLVRRPSFGVTLVAVLTPVVLMMGKALADILAADGNAVRTVLDFLGTPLVALLIAVVVGFFTLGRGAGMGTRALATSMEKALPPIAGIILIVAAGGGFKQTLVDTGIGKLVAQWVQGSGISVLLLAWVVAVLIRLATGSATVATVTASGILAPLAAGMSTGEVSLLVLAIGAGSVFFSHVNDAGFWLVKEYFGLSVGQTIKSWSLMETVLSVTGLVFVLVLGLVV